MPDQNTYEFSIDKFTFQVHSGLWYNEAGIWSRVDPAAGTARLGLGDYRQQASGDIAFVDTPDLGTSVKQGEELAGLETVKVDLEVVSPVSGTIVQVNEKLSESPELINQDPYGDGWLVEVRLANWEADRANLLDALAYFEVMKAQAEADAA